MKGARSRTAGGAWRLGLVVGLLVAAGGCAGEEVPRQTSGSSPDPIILVSIDTLRADRLPAYGYSAVETPAIDALRRDSLLFERAYTHVPLTLPAHASLFTGRLPSQHGVRDNAGYRLDAQSPPLLAQLLRQRGYATAGAVSSFVLRSATGLGAGFDLYEEGLDTGLGGLDDLQRPGLATLDAVRPWLRQVATRPFFLFLHLYEPHTPYTPPEPFASRYDSPYDAEVATVDRVVGELVAELKRLRVYNEALVVLLSDHGEGLGDHGEVEHGVLLYREVLHVPLLVKLPHGERAGATVETPVQLVDVLPTIVALVGMDPPLDLPGESLLDIAHREQQGTTPEEAPPRRLFAETLYPRLHLGWSELASVVEGPFHYIRAPEPELYNLEEDPQERRNLLQENRPVSRALNEALAQYPLGAIEARAEDPGTRQRLAALGYLATSSSSGSRAKGDLPDPKSQLPALRDLETALGHIRRRELDAAVPALRRLLEKSPAMVDAWRQLARAHEEMGQIEAALEAQREAVRHSHGAPREALAAAPLFLRLGQLDEARAHAELATGAFPVTAHNLLARIALAQGDPREAARQARQAVEGRRGRGGELTPLVTLGEVLVRTEGLESALQWTRQVEEEFAVAVPPDPRILVLQGRLLSQLGREAEARASRQRALVQIRQTLDRRPELAAGHTLLAQIHLQQNEWDEARQALERARRRGGGEGALWLELARGLAQAGRGEEAVELLDPLVRDGDSEALFVQAMTLSDLGHQDRALPLLYRLQETSPKNPRTLESLGMVELRKENFHAATDHLRQALDLDPKRPEAWNMLGVALLRGAGDAQGALGAWQRALELDPKRLKVLYNLGFVAADVGRADLARDALRRFIEVAPRSDYEGDIRRARARLAQLGG